MVSRILVPLDGSSLAETVLPYVKHLATPMNWDVELLRVLQTADTAPPAEGEISGAEAAQAYLRKAESYFRGSMVSVTARTAGGNPAAQIIWDSEHNPVESQGVV